MGYILSYLAQFADPMYWVGFLLSLPIIIFSLSFHEAAHAFAANKLGDPTARNLGRLTLNPLKHLDPIGTVCMILFHFGYAKPVPVNSRNFKNPKKGMALTAIAGPVSNLILALAGVTVYAFVCEIVARTGLWETNANIANILIIFFGYIYQLNIYLAVFNLLPVPPLDGSRLALLFLPDKIYWGVMKYERYIMIGMFILLLTGILTVPLNLISNIVMWLFELPFKIIPFFGNFIR